MWQPVDRPPAIQAAAAILARDFPDCLAAFMGGSVVRGEATATSDLDLMIIVPDDHPSYRESLHDFGWPIEVFVQTPAVHHYFARHDAARRSPSTSRMVCEGVVLQDRDGWAARLKEADCALLAAGPAPLTEQELAFARYFVTDLMDDLMDARPDEKAFIAWELAQNATNLILDWHRQWRGRGKWLLRSLRHFDATLAEGLREALHQAMTTGDTTPLLAFAAQALEVAGGRLWEGFRADAPDVSQ